MGRYTTTKGDTLRQLALDAGMSVKQLLELNPSLRGSNTDDGPGGKDKLDAGIELRLGVGRTIDGKRTAPGADRVSRDELQDMTPEERAEYQAGRKERREFQERKRTRTLMQDTGYAAFMRNMGFSEAEIENNLQALKDSHLRQIQQRTPLFEDQRIQAEARVNTDFEESGLFRSGERLDEVGRRRNEVDSEQASFEFDLQEIETGAEADAASKVAELQRRQAEEALAATERLTMAETERELARRQRGNV